MLSAFIAVVCASAVGQDPPPARSHAIQKTSTSETTGRTRSVAAEPSPATQFETALTLRRKLTEKDLRAAIRLFEESARQFRISGLPLKAAQAELEAGDTHFMASRYGAALRSYRYAQTLASADPEAHCVVLSHMARTYANMGKIREAKRYSKRALGLCGANDPKALADALEAWGETFFWAGDQPEALDSFSLAHDLFIEANDRDGQALTLLMLANSMGQSDRAEAIQHAGDALRLWSSEENRHGMAKARMALAFFAGAAGEFERAQCDCNRALAVFHGIADKDDEAIVLNILGRVARETGDAEASLDYYRQARAAFARVQDLLGEADAISGMGAALTDLRWYRELLPLYSQKLLLARRTGHRSLLASALMNMADVHQMAHHAGKAETLYRQALEEYRAAKNKFGASDVLMRLAGLEAEQGKDNEAIAFLEQARELKQDVGQIEDVAKIQYQLARIYRDMHRLPEAQIEIEKTIAIIESQRLSIAKFDSRAQYFASVHQYYSLYIEILMRLDRLHPDQGLMQLAFEASEKSKVRSLLDLLTNSGQASPCNDSPALDSGFVSAPLPVQDNVRDAAVSPQVLTLKQIQTDIVDDNSILAEYALGDEISYMWVVDSKTIVSHELPPSSQIRNLARTFRDDMVPLQPEKEETASEYYRRERDVDRLRDRRSLEVARVLIGPISPAPGKRLLIVPDGYLQYIPFSALPSLQPGEEGGVLLEKHEIAMLPSASALGVLRAASGKRSIAASGTAILADPVFERDSTRTTAGLRTRSVGKEYPRDLQHALRDGPRGSQHIAGLPGSRREALEIQKILGADNTLVALGLDANRDAVLSGAFSSFLRLHFATHGIIDVRHPEMSGLILSLINARGERQDGYLRLGDIYKLKLSADLVVLSSCESALGKELESEGTIGLPRGFLHAGARRVIASLWKVDDDATAILMKKLYTRMQGGENPTAALRGAQLDMKRDEQYSKPYYWAAFVLEGEYR